MTDDRRPDESADDRRDGGWLASLLAALERLDRGSDYGVSVRTGLDALEDRRDADGRRPPGRRPSGVRPSARLSDANAADERERYNVTSHEREGEVVVTADVTGVDDDDVVAGVDRDGALVVAVDGRRIERVRPPWDTSAVEATVNNGILTVVARRDADD